MKRGSAFDFSNQDKTKNETQAIAAQFDDRFKNSKCFLSKYSAIFEDPEC